MKKSDQMFSHFETIGIGKLKNVSMPSHPQNTQNLGFLGHDLTP